MLAQEKKTKPAHDPPGQLFRHAPMSKATRSIVIPMGDIRLAFDTEQLRTHTLWRGELDLYGPQHAHSKRPFIAQPNGQLLWSNPPGIPWRSSAPSATSAHDEHRLDGRFTGTTTETDSVTLRYELQTKNNKTIAVRLNPSLTQHGLDRRLSISPCSQALWFLANSYEEGAFKHDLTINGHMGTTIQVVRLPLSYREPIVTEAGAESVYDTAITDTIAEQHWVRIPAHDTEITVTIRHSGILQAGPDRPPSPLAKLGKIAQAKYRPNAGLTNRHYTIEHLPIPPELELLITGMDWLENGRLAVCTWPGEVYLLDDVLGEKSPLTFHRLAKGLNEPMGLLAHDGKLYVSQKQELTEIDFDENSNRTEFNRVSADWGYSGHYNAFSYGPVVDRDGQFILANAGHSGRWDMKFMGWGIRQVGDGRMKGIAAGLREPNGVGVFGPWRDVFVTDNQGQWTAACKLNHLRHGHYFGHPSALPAAKKLYNGRNRFTPPAVWFPYTLARSVSGMAEVMDDRLGPFKGQLLVGDFQNALLVRVFLEKINGNYQGAVFPFLNGFRSGVNRLSYGPDGRLYVGGLQRTWASIAPEPASLERVTFSREMPFSIRKVEAKHDGFLLTFTEPVMPSVADSDNFDVSQFRYSYHADYGSPRYNHSGKKGSQTSIEATGTSLSSDRLELSLKLSSWQPGHVTQVRCFDVFNEGGESLWHDTFHYTLNEIPAP
ncbi:MAG: PQQ-dependent sugar dehydrogenase [Verrucomicrobiota bacterium]|nr:PQQ-dependent sugar dehydrogenase [Verrucomicrobiota bacterium]